MVGPRIEKKTTSTNRIKSVINTDGLFVSNPLHTWDFFWHIHTSDLSLFTVASDFGHVYVLLFLNTCTLWLSINRRALKKMLANQPHDPMILVHSACAVRNLIARQFHWIHISVWHKLFQSPSNSLTHTHTLQNRTDPNHFITSHTLIKHLQVLLEKKN